ncbi:PREDICTED: transcription factor PIL1 isoform X2 [Tarenaya hassleriana]|uniref:transcription factor PIL1 isoform X2 n=1 Tax=Tarenaya hassleriana TaxID=28532 RepID=UPI00053C59A4|nr:PREDICTED: transcription factor PIL1 isoform X2 [Tarenaya hassleriana]
MEEDPFAPLSNFISKRLEEHEYMELVWENGQILTRGRRSNVYSTRNPPSTTSLFLDLHEADKNLGDTQVVPVGENTREETDKSTKEKIKLSVAAHNKKVAIHVEPKTEVGLPAHKILVKERDGGRVESTVHSLKAMADQTNHKELEFSPPDAQSVAMGRYNRYREKVGSVKEENESSDSLGWSTQLCSSSFSICSRGTSQDPIISSPRRTSAESEGSIHLSTNTDVESEDEGPQVPARKTTKRKQSRDFDDLAEREQRHEIKKRMIALRNLLPNNCNKDKKSSLLDEAIEYTRKLQLQIQFRLMSMANGFAAPQMMYYSPLVHYSPLGLGFGTPPFVSSPVPGPALPNQPGPVPFSSFSFYPIEPSSQQCFRPAASSTQFQRSDSVSSLDNSQKQSSSGEWTIPTSIRSRANIQNMLMTKQGNECSWGGAV